MTIAPTAEQPSMQRSTISISSAELLRLPGYSTQYFRTYCVRLKCLSSVLAGRIAETWGDSAPVKSMSYIEPDERCVLIGTIYKDTADKPSVVKEMTESYQQLGARGGASHRLTSEQDRVFLEDAQQRIELLLDRVGTPATRFLTGVVLAVLGHEPEASKGRFVVEAVLYATPSPPPSLLQSPSGTAAGTRLVAIVSGLRVSGDSFVPLQLFFDWLSGALLVGGVQVDPASIGRLVVAGDSIEPPEPAPDQLDQLESEGDDASDWGAADIANLELLDRLLASVCPSIPVDIMTGPNDPCSPLLPQRPMHPAMFPRSSRWSSFHSRPNPWMFSLDDEAGFAVGTAGQTIDDIDKYCDIDDPLDRIAATVEWGHAAPTAPDTLRSYPNMDDVDPLIIPHRPSLYFAGNQSSFQWRHDQATDMLLVTVPRFCESGEVVLVDMQAMSCRSVVFR